MKLYRGIFYFLLLIPVFLLTIQVRETLIDIRNTHAELFLLNAQMNSHQRTILGLECRILHYAEEHEEPYLGCPLCFENLIREQFDHELIRKFLRENNIGPPDIDLTEENLKTFTGWNAR